MIKHKILPLALFSNLTLVACGGGSGGSDPASSFSALPRIAIDASNSTEVVHEGLAVADSSPLDIVGTSLKPDSNSSPVRFNLVKFVAEQRKRSNVALRTESESCSGGGSIIFNGNDDFTQVTLTFNSCVEDGVTINGGFSISGADSSASISFDQFSVTGADFSLFANGIISSTYTQYADHDRLTMNGNSMVMSMSYQGRSLEIGNFSATFHDYWSAGYETYDYQYEINSSELGGSYAVQTTQTLYMNYYQDYPYQGQVVISGANASKVRATSQGGDASSLVLIEVDANGDGAYETTTSKTWAEIESEASLLN